MTRPRYLHVLDEADETLSLLPYSARRALDHAGRKLSLEGFRSLSFEDRESLSLAGLQANVDVSAVEALSANANPAATSIEPLADPSAEVPPMELVVALPGPLDPHRWSSLSTLDRYVLAKRVSRGRADEIAIAYETLVNPPGNKLTHVDDHGDTRMVSVRDKERTLRRAVASATITMRTETRDAIEKHTASKGDVLGTAKVAGIMAAKRTHDLIPLCHQIALTHVEVTFELRGADAIVVRATAEAIDRTGVEMEAMVAASTAALTIYDMVKAIDRWMTIGAVQLEEKSGGRSGTLLRGGEE